MHSAVVAIVATAGAAISLLTPLPQVVRTWRTRSAADFSALSLAGGLLGALVWLCYGMLIDAQAVVCANALGILQGGYFLMIKLQGSRRLPTARAP